MHNKVYVHRVVSRRVIILGIDYCSRIFPEHLYILRVLTLIRVDTNLNLNGNKNENKTYINEQGAREARSTRGESSAF